MSASSAPWQTTRLWGTGAWTLPATQSVTLRHFQPSGRVALEIVRVSAGGPHCSVRAGARLVWSSGSGAEVQARGIFLREVECDRAGLKASPFVDDCAVQPGRVLHRFHGRVRADELYSQIVAPYRIQLRPMGRFGWTIGVRPLREDRELTSMIPLHGRSGRDIFPEDVREHAWVSRQFTFHPGTGTTIVHHDDTLTMLVDDLRVSAYGRGRLTIDRYGLGTTTEGQPRFEWIEFRGCLSWPK